MQNDKQETFAIFVFFLIGILGVPAGIYQWILLERNDWVCYSKHGHILELPAACRFNLFTGLSIAAAALAFGLYGMYKRRNA